MSKLRVLIVDDHEIVRSGLVKLLQFEPDIEVIGEAINGDQALALVTSLEPDIILLDIKMPGTNGLALTPALKTLAPNAKVIILTIYTESYVTEAIHAGADGYLSKNISGAELAKAIREAADGQVPLHFTVSPDKLEHVGDGLQPESVPTLTERQIAMLRLVAQGKSNGEIAQAMSVSERTVKRELSSIFELFNVNGRAEAVAYASKRGLI